MYRGVHTSITKHDKGGLETTNSVTYFMECPLLSYQHNKRRKFYIFVRECRTHGKCLLLPAWWHHPFLGLLFAVDGPVATLAVDQLSAEGNLFEPLLVEGVSNRTLTKYHKSAFHKCVKLMLNITPMHQIINFHN